MIGKISGRGNLRRRIARFEKRSLGGVFIVEVSVGGLS